MIRKQLRDLKTDCAIVTGSNLFYLTNGLPGERYAIFPTDGKPPTVVINFRNLADISVQVLLDMQEWIADIRGGLDAAHIIERIKELQLESGTLGFTGFGYGGIDHGFYAQIQKAFPAAKLVDVSDVFHNVRTIKSEEEIAMLDAANKIFDAAVRRVCEVARPGMLGRRVLEEGIRAMWGMGGNTHSSFNFHFGAVPKQNPVLMQLCLDQVIQKGAIGTLTGHAEYRHYAGHSDHQISFGEPTSLHKELFSAVLFVRDAVLKTVREGVTHLDLSRHTSTHASRLGPVLSPFANPSVRHRCSRVSWIRVPRGGQCEELWAS